MVCRRKSSQIYLQQALGVITSYSIHYTKLYDIDGVPTNIPLHREITRDADFIEGLFDTGYLDKNLKRFNLDARHHIEEEEQRIASITRLIGSIKQNNIAVRH